MLARLANRVSSCQGVGSQTAAEPMSLLCACRRPEDGGRLTAREEDAMDAARILPHGKWACLMHPPQGPDLTRGSL
jgi:hypothetical protein